jgi:p24 family protein alpha
MRSLIPFLSLLSVAHALFFYIDGSSTKCFFEELPKGTLVVGHYSGEEWDDRANAWQQHQGINIFISVDVRVLPGLPKPLLIEQALIMFIGDFR